MLGQRTFVVSDNYIRQQKSRDRFVQNQDQEIALIFFLKIKEIQLLNPRLKSNHELMNL